MKEDNLVATSSESSALPTFLATAAQCDRTVCKMSREQNYCFGKSRPIALLITDNKSTEGIASPAAWIELFRKTPIRVSGLCVFEHGKQQCGRQVANGAATCAAAAA